MYFHNNKTLNIIKPPNIIVFGDIMLDHHIDGIIEKLANEAPIPVLHKKSELFSLGGCGNVLMNLHSLHCESLTLFSMIGNDLFGKTLKNLLDSSNIKYHLIESGITTVKNRFFCDKKILFRYDEEEYKGLLYDDEEILVQEFLQIVRTKKIDSIIFSDYNKGFLTESLCKKIIQIANKHNILTCVDPKNNYEKYIGCSLIKPNKSEVKKLFNIDCSLENIKETLNTIQTKVNCKYVVITLADKGISFLNNNKLFLYNTQPIDVIDVTGAGDIVNTIISYYFPSVDNKNEIIKLASYLATKSVSHSGTYIITKEDIILANRELNNSKLINLQDIKFIKSNITFTNGCFDILHKGHLELFKFCKEVNPNNLLIIGLNSDDSIKHLKGDSRPINSVESRVAMLNAIKDVDYIVVFEEDTPVESLKVIKPEILVKGGDYTYDTILGKEFCKEVKIFKTLEGYSTTNIIKKSKSS